MIIRISGAESLGVRRLSCLVNDKNCIRYQIKDEGNKYHLDNMLSDGEIRKNLL